MWVLEFFFLLFTRYEKQKVGKFRGTCAGAGVVGSVCCQKFKMDTHETPRDFNFVCDKRKNRVHAKIEREGEVKSSLKEFISTQLAKKNPSV